MAADKNQTIQVRPKGKIRAALERAAKLDPQGRNMSDIMRDAFWEWHAKQTHLQPRRRVAK